MKTKTFRQHIVMLEFSDGYQGVAGTFDCMCVVHEKDDGCGYLRAHVRVSELREQHPDAFRIAVYELRSQDVAMDKWRVTHRINSGIIEVYLNDDITGYGPGLSTRRVGKRR